jgi:hypothetical protein
MWPRLLFADWRVPLLAVTSHFSVLGTRINEILDVSTSKVTSLSHHQSCVWLHYIGDTITRLMQYWWYNHTADAVLVIQSHGWCSIGDTITQLMQYWWYNHMADAVLVIQSHGWCSIGDTITQLMQYWWYNHMADAVLAFLTKLGEICISTSRSAIQVKIRRKTINIEEKSDVIRWINFWHMP